MDLDRCFRRHAWSLSPDWLHLGARNFGMLKTWSVTHRGSFVDGVQISDVTPI